MTASTFDTLTAAQDLEAAGVERHQAEAIAKAIRNGQGDLATRADLAAFEERLGKQFAERETRLVKWGYGVAAAAVALTVTLNAGLMYAMLRLFVPAGP